MPSVNDPTFNEEDTPDDLKGPKSAKKRKQKKAAKQRAAEEYKDSSSEGPKLSPDLLPVIDHSQPSPPPSPPPHILDGGAAEGDLIGNIVAPYEQTVPVDDIVLPPESSSQPDDDHGVTATRDNDDAGPLNPPPMSLNIAHHVPSLSSSPQGGIRLPPNSPQLRHTYSASPPAHSALPLRERQASLTSHLPRPLSVYDPPPPHMPQRHFARRPDMDFGLSSPSEPTITAGSRGYFCGFDSLEKANAGTSPAANNLVLVGTQGGLDVYRLLRQRSDIIGRLEGLRGAVLDAKIIPWTDRHDPFFTLRPLVMCVLHGPVDESETKDDTQARPAESSADPIMYRTTVEIFSLASARSLCCLYESPHVPKTRLDPLTSIGNLRIAAEGRFITVASGVSGEVHVFSPYTPIAPDGAPPFRCIAKFWTVTTTSTPVPGPDGMGISPSSLCDSDSRSPIFALSARWLAIRPPLLSSSQTSLQGNPLLSPSNPDPPGVSAHVSPPPPTVNCGVDAPFSNTLFDRVAKQATQEIRKGAQWVGEHGKQVWNAYWSRSSPPQTDSARHGAQTSVQNDAAIFPPTHAQSNDSHSITVEPASISIIDLQKLVDFEENPTKGALTPLSTFCLPDGCSFVSFAPGGLSLLTTNQVGDASTIWDMSRITVGNSPARYDAQISASGSPYVSIMARFARQTPSVVTDVAWSAHGKRVALLTQKGTIHLHEVPASSSRPLLPFNGAAPSVNSGIPSPGTSPQGDAPLAGFVNTVRARFQTLPGISLRAQSNTNSLGVTVSNASAYARHTGRKALKQGVNIATDTALKIRHHEETKIRLQPKQHTLRPACLRWLSGRESGLIATVIDGKIRLHTVKSNHYVQGKRTALYLTASRRPVGESHLNTINGDAFRADATHPQCARTGSHGFWALNKANLVKQSPNRADQFSASILQDKDTSPTYLPFHRAPQVDLFAFTDSASTSMKKQETSGAGRGPGSEQFWVFGLPLPPTTRVTCQQAVRREVSDDSIGGGDMDDILAEMPDSPEEGNGLGVFEM